MLFSADRIFPHPWSLLRFMWRRILFSTDRSSLIHRAPLRFMRRGILFSTDRIFPHPSSPAPLHAARDIVFSRQNLPSSIEPCSASRGARYCFQPTEFFLIHRTPLRFARRVMLFLTDRIFPHSSSPALLHAARDLYPCAHSHITRDTCLRPPIRTPLR
jgi:hypothetical protein